MKLTLPDSRPLKQLAEWAMTAVPGRPTIPVLSCLQLTVGEDGSMSASGFDYDTSAQVTLPTGTATAATAGTITIGGRVLAAVAGRLPAGKPVRMAMMESGQVLVECGSFEARLSVYTDEDYPRLPEIPPPGRVVDGDWLRAALRRVTSAATKDDTLPSLTGVRLEMDAKQVTLAATDRYRLAIAQVDLSEPATVLDEEVSVSAVMLDKWAKADCPLGAPAGLSVMPNEAGRPGMLGLTVAGRSMATRLLGDDFPRWQTLAADECFSGEKLTVNANDMIGALRRAMEFLPSNDPGVSLSVSAGTQTVQISANTDVHSSTETLGVVFTGDTDKSMVFNAAFLADGLDAATQGISDDAVINLNVRENGAVKITSSDPADKYLQILMPIRRGAKAG